MVDKVQTGPLGRLRRRPEPLGKRLPEGRVVAKHQVELGGNAPLHRTAGGCAACRLVRPPENVES